MIAECVVELNVEHLYRVSSAAPSDDVEMHICNEYVFTHAAAQSDIQLIAFAKFKERFSAFIMISDPADLNRLYEWYLGRKLREFIESTVKSIVRGVRVTRIAWTMKDLDRCNTYFVSDKMTSTTSTPSSSLSQTSPSPDFGKMIIFLLSDSHNCIKL